MHITNTSNSAIFRSNATAANPNSTQVSEKQKTCDHSKKPNIPSVPSEDSTCFSGAANCPTCQQSNFTYSNTLAAQANMSALLQSDKEQEAFQARDALLESSMSQLDNMDDEIEAQKDMFDTFMKCLKIAARIENGDHVPMKDEKFLFENQPDLYMKAILMRRVNDDPKDYDSLLEDEQEEASDGTQLDTAAQPSSEVDTSCDTTSSTEVSDS